MPTGRAEAVLGRTECNFLRREQALGAYVMKLGLPIVEAREIRDEPLSFSQFSVMRHQNSSYWHVWIDQAKLV